MSEIKVITEKDNRADIEEWFAEAPKQTFETLPEFIRHVMNDYEHDYGTVCHAIAACAVATAWACNEMEGACGGITGFQAGAVMWTFIRRWNYKNNKCGLKILDYDKMLYPQYASYFKKTIDKDTWEALQKQARKELEGLKGDIPFAPAGSVVAHWKSIADGIIPFGFSVEEER